jgi:hypothetical protein
MGPLGNIADNEMITLPYTYNWKSMPGECIFTLSLLVGKQLVAPLAIDPYALGAPCEDLIGWCRIIHNIPQFIGFFMLWSGAWGLGLGVFFCHCSVGHLPCLLLFLEDSKSVAIESRNMRKRGMRSHHVAVKLLECGAKVRITCRLGRVGGMWYDKDSG